MKKLWKKGLPALVLLVFGVMSAGCDNGTTSSSDGDSVAVAAQRFARELDKLFEGSGYTVSGEEESIVEVRGAPRFDVRLDMKTPNVTKELSIPAGVTLRLGNGTTTPSSAFVFKSRATLEDNVGKATLILKGNGTLELTAAGSLCIVSDDTVANTSQLVIESGLTIKFSAAATDQPKAISEATPTAAALPASQITWKPGSKIGAGKNLKTADINGKPTQDDDLALDFIIGSATSTPTELALVAGDKIGALTINKGGQLDSTAATLTVGQTIVTGKVTVKGTSNANGGIFAPKSAAGNFIVNGDIVVNNGGAFEPVDQIQMKKVYLNDKATATIPKEKTFKFSELYIAKDAALTVTAATTGGNATTLAVVGVKLDNKGTITVEQGTTTAASFVTLKLTVDPNNKQTHINEGTIIVQGKTGLAAQDSAKLWLSGGVTLENKGTIKFAIDAVVGATASKKGVIEIDDDSTLVNSKIIDLVDALGCIVFTPGSDLYPTLTFTPGSELRGVRVAKTLASAGNNLGGATLWNCDDADTQANLEFDDFQGAFDAYVGVSPYGTTANPADLGTATTGGVVSTNDSGYLKFKEEWGFTSESAATIGVNSVTVGSNVELVLEYDES